MKFLVDMPLSPEMAAWLNTHNHEAIHASDAGLGKSPDEDILRRALEEGRVVVTCDLDFPQLLAMTAAKGPPVILLRGANYSQAEEIELLDRVLGAIAEQELSQCLVVVDRKRIRRTRLPLRPS